MSRRSRIALAIGMLLILQSLLRLFFYYEAAYAGVPRLQPMPAAAKMSVINSVNMGLGLVGLVVVPGLLLMTRWGYWGTVALSAVTIVFDGTSAVAASFVTFAGLILPVIFLIILLSGRAKYF